MERVPQSPRMSTQTSNMSLRQRWIASDAKNRELMLITAFAFVGLVALATLLLSHPVVDQDVWHEIALARELFQSGTLPTVDPFSYTPTVDFIQHEWLAGVFALWAVQYGGGFGLALLKYLLGIALAAFLTLRLRMERGSLVVLAPVVFLALNMLQPGFGAVRAQIYSLVAVAALLWFLALDRNGNRRWMGAWLPLFVIWLNVHGGFILAFGILGAEWIERACKGRRDWHLVALGSAMLAAVSINPYGLRYYLYMAEALTIRRPDIKEWQPIWEVASVFPASVIAFTLSLLVLAYAVRVRGWRNATGIGIVLLLMLASIRTNRITMFYGLAFLCTVPALLQGSPVALWGERTLRRFSTALLPATAILALLLAGVAATRQPFQILVPAHALPAWGQHVVYPVAAVDYLRQQQFRGNLMVSFPIGAYVMWKLHPNVKISMDSRYEVAYPPLLVEQFIELYRSGAGASEILRTYPHDALLVEADSPLRQAVETDARWNLVYSDPVYRIYAPHSSPLAITLTEALPAHGTIP